MIEGLKMSSKLIPILHRTKFQLFSTSTRNAAKPKVVQEAAAPAKKAIIVEPEPVRDTKLLVTKCCGLNKYVGQDDPELKADDEYPDWLWTIHTGKPKEYFELDPNTKEYWLKLEEAKKEQAELARNEKTFYIPPRDYELSFKSRLPLK